MSRIRRMGLVASMEEEELANAPVVDDAELAENVAEVGNGVAENNESSAEVSDLADGVDEGVTAIDDAEAVIEPIADTVSGDDPEGADETAIQAATAGLESIFNRLGMNVSRHTMIPSLEQFGSKSSRVMATKIALEGFTDKLKEIWEAIKRAIKNLWEKLKGIVANLFNNAAKMKVIFEDLGVKAADLKKLKSGAESNYKSSNVAKAMWSNKPEDMIIKVGLHTAINEEFKEYPTQLKTFINKLASGEIENGILENLAQNLYPEGFVITDADSPKNTLAFGLFIKKEGDGEETKFTMTYASDKDIKEDCPILKKDQIERLCIAGSALLDKFNTVKNAINTSITAGKDMEKVCDKYATTVSKMSKDSDGEPDVELQATMKKARAMISQGLKAANSTLNAYPNLTIRLAKAAIDYVRFSMKQYETDKDKAKK